MARYPNATKRLAAEVALKRQGFEVRSKTAQGVPLRARFELRRAGEELLEALVRTSEVGRFGFRRDSEGDWPLRKAKLILTATKCTDPGKPGIEVLAFPTKIVRAALDAALHQLRALNRAPPNEIPVFISIDPYDKVDFGYTMPGIRKDKSWGEIIPPEELMPQIVEGDQGYLEEARREFAKRNGVDVRRVTLTFSIGP